VKSFICITGPAATAARWGRLDAYEVDIATAIEAAAGQGDYVNQDREATNASPRLKDALRRLQATLASHKNIVQIGARVGKPPVAV
jgi:hypothetical protein